METGKYIYADGASYVGDWKSGFRHGLGAHTKADGTKYTGSWVKGKMHGKGEHRKARWERLQRKTSEMA